MYNIGLYTKDPALLEAVKAQFAQLASHADLLAELFCLESPAACTAAPDLTALLLDTESFDGSDEAFYDFAEAVHLADPACSLVLVGSTLEQALLGYHLEAADFLCRPVSADALNDTLQRVVRRRALRLAGAVKLRVGGHWLLLNADEISSVESRGHHLEFCMADGRRIRTHSSIEPFADALALNGSFFRCHKSYIVNKRFITGFVQSGEGFAMASGAVINISRTYRKAARRLWLERGMQSPSTPQTIETDAFAAPAKNSVKAAAADE